MPGVNRPRAQVVIGGAGKFATVQKRLLLSAISTRLTGRALNYGFLADDSSPQTPARCSSRSATAGSSQVAGERGRTMEASRL